jgi:hypothetical protein
VRLVLSWTRGRKGPIVPWGGEGIWRRTRGFLESRTHRSFSILHNSERWSAESWWRLFFLRSGLGLFSVTLVLSFSSPATSLFAPLARRAGLA